MPETSTRIWSVVSSFGLSSVHLAEGERVALSGDVAAPEVAAPLVAASGDAAPGVAAPDVAAPLVAAPGVAAPGVATPDVAAPGNSPESMMEALRDRVGDCRSCRLSETRNSLVFGEGSPSSGVVFVGEGPGASEDETGRPFVGRAGQLLDRILASIGLDRTCVYIANVVKCRPPGNRVPAPDEVSACAWILEAQMAAMRPGVIVALGASAACALLGARQPIGQLRGAALSHDGIPVLVTYHPAALLRTPALKRPVWDDMKRLSGMLEMLGLPRRGTT